MYILGIVMLAFGIDILQCMACPMYERTIAALHVACLYLNAYLSQQSRRSHMC